MLSKPHTLSVSGADIVCNTRVKTYPDGSWEALCCDRDIFKAAGWEEAGREGHLPASHQRHDGPSDVDRAMRRAKAQVRDLALCTDFKYFVTLTLDAAQVDRYDMDAITRKLNHWCDNQVRRKGLSYVLVPERHKDGAIHFHGFFNGALEAVDSGTITMAGFKRPRKPRSAAQRAEWLEGGGHVVYNLPGWSLGYTTAIGLYGEYAKAVSYVCKYIGKSGEKIGGRWYYSGGQLGHPEILLCDAQLRDLETASGAYRFDVKAAGLSFVLVRGEGGRSDEIMGANQVHGGGDPMPSGWVLRQKWQDGLRRLPEQSAVDNFG